MGKNLKMRRKQWRKIDTQDVSDALEKSTREERQGLVVDGIPDADLFFVDTAPDDGIAVAVEQAKVPKKQHARERLTRAQAILQGAHSAQPITHPLKKYTSRPAAVTTTAPGPSSRKKKAASAAPFDLWAAEVPSGKRHRPVPGCAAAVPVDAAGCSFNPDREMHQDAVAEAVAAELKKITSRQLLPTAPLRTVDYDVERDELALLQVEEEREEEDGGAQHSDNEEEEGAKRGGAARKKSQKDRNREQRRKEGDAELVQRRKDKLQRHQLSQLGAVTAEVEATLAARAARLERRHADAAERAATEPPRLGRHRFEPLPIQVLATQEVVAGKGSLRRLKATPVLARERFKSLQRRGMIEPRRKVVGKKGKKVEFVHGKLGEKAAERQAEVEELRASRRKAGKQAK